jgi:hypothetical protein
VQIGERGLVGRDQTGAGTHLYAEVAQRHAPFHRQRAHGRPGIFDDMAGRRVHPQPREQEQHHVLGLDIRGQPAIDRDPHVARTALAHGLGRQHVLDLGRPDAERQRAERAVRGGMAVSADDRHARLRAALFGRNHMDDAVARIAHRELLDSMPSRVFRQRRKLRARLHVGDGGNPGGLPFGRHVVIGQRQRPLRPAHRPPFPAQSGKGLGRSDLVQQVQIDVEQRIAVVRRNRVRVPYLVIERARTGHRMSPIRRIALIPIRKRKLPETPAWNG